LEKKLFGAEDFKSEIRIAKSEGRTELFRISFFEFDFLRYYPNYVTFAQSKTHMLRSMTGYGQAETENSRYQIKVEFKALNNKFLELNLRMPKVWQSKDLEVRRELNRMVERGSCQVNISVDFKRAEDKVMPINKDVAKYYLDELSSITKAYGISNEALAQNILTIPNLFQPVGEEKNEEDDKLLMEAINKAGN
jgi:uncharacterized protein (TIGR00255 family)